MSVVRMKPEQIQAGKSYRLMARHAPVPLTIRKVEAIEGENVIVNVRGENKPFSLKLFADLAVEEVQVVDA